VLTSSLSLLDTIAKAQEDRSFDEMKAAPLNFEFRAPGNMAHFYGCSADNGGEMVDFLASQAEQKASYHAYSSLRSLSRHPGNEPFSTLDPNNSLPLTWNPSSNVENVFPMDPGHERISYPTAYPDSGMNGDLTAGFPHTPGASPSTEFVFESTTSPFGDMLDNGFISDDKGGTEVGRISPCTFAQFAEGCRRWNGDGSTSREERAEDAVSIQTLSTQGWNIT
jgi:hypothetical protein